MNRIEDDRLKQWDAILKLGKPQPDQSRLLTDEMDTMAMIFYNAIPMDKGGAYTLAEIAEKGCQARWVDERLGSCTSEGYMLFHCAEIEWAEFKANPTSEVEG